MTEWFNPLLDCLVESFPIRSPLFEFGYDPDHATKDEKETVLYQSAAALGSHEYPIQNVSVEGLDDLTRLPFADGSVPTVICSGAIEHIFEPRKAAEEMIRILAPGGLLVIAAAGNGAKSRPAGPCWHFTPNSMQRLLTGLDASLIGWQGPEMSPHTVFGIGTKGPVEEPFIDGVSQFVRRFEKYLDEQKNSHSWVRQLKRRVKDWVCGGKKNNPPADFYQVQFLMHTKANRMTKRNILKRCLAELPVGSKMDIFN
jgi:SAM-dependent methyltransferase